MTMEWDASSLFSHFNVKEELTQRVAEQRLMDAVDDLARISQSIAPISTGYLRQQVEKSVTTKRGEIYGDVSYTATSDGNFDYALWTHEYMTSLGPRSSASPGVSGYTVGPKYVTRPLEGEKKRWLSEIATGVKGVLD